MVGRVEGRCARRTRTTWGSKPRVAQDSPSLLSSVMGTANFTAANRRTVERDAGEAGFREFVREAEPRLRRALVAAYGLDRGREAACDALAYAWEHWDRLRSVENLVGYLYRVGQSSLRTRKKPVLFAIDDDVEPLVEPALAGALARLPERQRASVVLVHAGGLTVREAADVLGVNASTVQRHVERALAALRLAIVEGAR
jgi:DNA-directed RNA polymerase specialized sigma24 family protein